MTADLATSLTVIVILFTGIVSLAIRGKIFIRMISTAAVIVLIIALINAFWFFVLGQ